MEQTIFDTKRHGLFRDRVQSFFIDKLIPTESMTAAHYHPYYELFYVVKGNCRIFIENRLFFVNENDLVILPSSTLHRTQYDNEKKVERITISFTKEYFDSLKFFDDIFLEEHLKMGKMNFNQETKEKLFRIFDELLLETKNPDSYSQINTKNLLSKLLILIARNSQNRQEKEALLDETTATIQKTAQYIFENYAQEITLKEISKIAGMRDTYFSKKFQEITGVGFKEYLLNIRLQHSIEMLKIGKLTITQIALACGFSDGNYFGDAFKKKMGISPRDFRKTQEK